MLLSQGCVYISSTYVRNIGVRRETFNLVKPESAYSTSNGTVVYEVEGWYYRPTFALATGDGCVTISKKARYLIGTPEALSNSVFHAEEIHNKSNLYAMTHFPLDSTNEPSWSVYPSSFYAPAATFEGIQQHLNVTELNPLLLPIEYPNNGHTSRFTFGKPHTGRLLDWNAKGREIRTWWGYPCQFLLVPAVAIDILTSPIQTVLYFNDLFDGLH